MAIKMRFDPEVPEGMQVWANWEEVKGTKHYLSATAAFAKGKDRDLRLIPEPANRFDPNAIAIFAIYKGWFLRHQRIIGYVAAPVAAAIAERGDLPALRPRLRSIWWGGHHRDFIVVNFDILEPMPAAAGEKRGRAFKPRTRREQPSD
jgi:hypothetical protein